MANEEHLKLLKGGVEGWNAWRRSNSTRPDLRVADLVILPNLSRANLSRLNLSRANLVEELVEAELVEAELVEPDLSGADLSGVDLRGADLRRADLSGTYLVGAELSSAFYNEETVWPEGFNPAEHGARLIKDDSSMPSPSSGFTITFDPSLSPQQIKAALQALAGYYRACGGLGFEIDFEEEEILVAEPEYAY